MTLFLLLLFPVVSIWLISRDFYIQQIFIDLRDYFLFRILLFIPSFFFINIFTGFLSQTYTVLNIYLYYLFADYFFFQVFSVLSCILRFRNVASRGLDEGINHYFLFLAGFYTAFTFYSAITGNQSADFYNFFFKPVTLLLMAAYTSFFLSLKDTEMGLLKYLFTVGIFIFPAISAFVPFFFYTKYPLFSLIVILVMAVPGWFFLYKNNFDI